jgi:hypothetical protein
MLYFKAAPPAEEFLRTYEPGEIVPASGLYQVNHDSHRLMHQATLEKDARFPQCRQCKMTVRFRLLRWVEDRMVHSFGATSLLEEYGTE